MSKASRPKGVRALRFVRVSNYLLWSGCLRGSSICGPIQKRRGTNGKYLRPYIARALKRSRHPPRLPLAGDGP